MKRTPPYDQMDLPDFLVLRLTCLPYLDFAFCVKRALEQAGYTSIRLSDRRHLRGRTNAGGYDMRALQETGLGMVPVLIQIKRSKTPITRRCVDELRGTQLRHGISYAVLATTSTFAKAAHLAAAAYPGRPIRLIEGRELGEKLVAARLGVLESLDIATGKTTLTFNEEPFELLMAYCAERHKRKRSSGAQFRREGNE